MITRRQRFSADEGGSALILALIFAVIFSVLVTAVITFADVGLKSSKGFRAKRISSTGPETTVEAAILNRANGGLCDDTNYTPHGVDDPDTGDVDESTLAVGGRDLVVRCQNVGVAPGTGAGSSTTPRSALLALGDHPDEGIVNSGLENIRIRGDVFSRSQINGMTGGLVVEGAVSALGACTNVVTDTNPSTPTECGIAGDPVDSRDPNFTKSTTAIPVRRTISDPSTLCADAINGWLVPVSPGYYDDAAPLTTLTTDGGPCDGKVIWMQPGTYYFDFGFRGGSPVWSITDPDVNVLAGEPKAFDPSNPPLSRPTLDVPGSCLATGDDAPEPFRYSDGVQVIAGGLSRIDVVDGRMEFCAPLPEADQQIAVYGIDERKETHILEPTAVVDSSGFMDMQKSFVADELVGDPSEGSARAELNPTTNPGPVSLKVGTFRQTIPTGSSIDSAVLRVRHRETGDFGTPPTLVVNGCSGSLVLPAQGVLDDDFFDLLADCGFDSPSDFSGLTVTYGFVASVGGTATALVDGITVDVQYREPLTRKPTGATVGGAGFSPVEAAFEIGERPEALATANLTAGTPTASITFAGFADPPLPVGAQIDSAVLRVRHQDGIDVTGQVTTSFPGCAAFASFANQPVLTTESPAPNLQACGLDTAGELAGLSVTYTATLGGALADADALLDGLWLELTYRPVLIATADDATASGSSAFSGAGASGRIIDGTSSEGSLAGAGSNAVLTLENWAVAIPSGSILDSAQLLVAHQEVIDTDLGSAAIDAKVTPTFSGNTCVAPGGIALMNSPTMLTTATLDLTACGLDELADLNDPGEFSAEYEAAFSGSGTGTVRVDGMALLLVYRLSVNEVEPTPTTVRNATAVGPPAPTAFPGGTADNALEVDGDTTDADLGNTATPPFNVTSASLTLQGYGTPALPAGSVIESAKLRVAHREDITLDDGGAAIETRVFADFPGSGCPLGLLLSNSPTEITTTAPPLDLMTECGLDQPEELAGFAARYESTFSGAGTATVRLDGMVLDIVFEPPSMRALSECHALTPYPAAGGSCALLKSGVGTSPTARLVVNGSIYAPSASLDLAMDEVDEGVITRGAIARHIRLDIRPEAGNNRPTIGVPPESVLFTAYPDGRHHPLEPTLGPPAVGEFALDPGGDPRFAPRHVAPADPGDPVDPPRLLSAEVDDTNPGTTDIAAVTLGAFAQATEAGPIDGAVLRIRYAVENTSNPAAPDDIVAKVTLTDPTHPACNGTRNLPASPALTTFSIDLTPCEQSTIGDFNDLSVTFELVLAPGAPLGTTGTVQLDGIVLDVYSGPLLRAEVSFERGRAYVEGWSVLS